MPAKAPEPTPPSVMPCAMPKPAIKLMPDYDCSPLWYHGGSKIGPVDLTSLGLSEALVEKLQHWAATYDSYLNRGDPATTTWTKEEEQRFDADGRDLFVL